MCMEQISYCVFVCIRTYVLYAHAHMYMRYMHSPYSGLTSGTIFILHIIMDVHRCMEENPLIAHDLTELRSTVLRTAAKPFYEEQYVPDLMSVSCRLVHPLTLYLCISCILSPHFPISIPPLVF